MTSFWISPASVSSMRRVFDFVSEFFSEVIFELFVEGFIIQISLALLDIIPGVLIYKTFPLSAFWLIISLFFEVVALGWFDFSPRYFIHRFERRVLDLGGPRGAFLVLFSSRFLSRLRGSLEVDDFLLDVLFSKKCLKLIILLFHELQELYLYYWSWDKNLHLSLED